MKSLKSYQNSQWPRSIGFRNRFFGFTIWKWSGILVPLMTLYVGKSYVAFDIFNHGYGFTFKFSPVLVLNVCIKGKIGLWYKYGILRFKSFNYLIEL